MKLSEQRKQELEEIYQKFYHDERIQRMKVIPMHRGSNCFEHSFKVAKIAIKRAMRHKKVVLEVVLLAAILHDYYLYDWRKDRALLKKHNKNHPQLAAENAAKDFGVDAIIQKAIKSHMWPINFKDFPNSKEARIVAVADKIVATNEAMTSIAYKNKHRDKYLKKLEFLFN